MKILLTWNEVVSLAEGKPHGHPDIKRYGTAFSVIAEHIREYEGTNIEQEERPNEYISDYVGNYGESTTYMFDEAGHLYIYA